MTRITTIVALLMLSVSSVATALPNDPWNELNPGDEMNVYEVYNTLYGTGYVDSSSIPQVALDEVFGDGYYVEAEARYAGAVNTWFGFYPGGGGPRTQLFSTNATGLLGGAPSGDTSGAPNPFGFYITGLANNGNYLTWYTEAALNSDGQDHAFLLATPDPDVFLLVFEDKPWDVSDKDYNDLIVELHRHIIPEPTSMALLGIGLAGMAVRRVRRAFSRA